MKRFPLLTLCSLLLLLAACEVETTEEPGGTMDVDIEAYRADIDVRTMEIDEAIESLEAKAANAGEEMREEYNEMIAELREERMEISNSIDAMQAETAEEFNEMKMEMDEELDELDRSIDRAQLAMAENAEELRMAANEQMAEIDREMDALGNEISEESREAMAALEAQREELAADLDRLGDATAEEFNEMKRSIADGFDRMGEAIGNIRIPVDIDVETEPIDS